MRFKVGDMVQYKKSRVHAYIVVMLLEPDTNGRDILIKKDAYYISYSRQLELVPPAKFEVGKKYRFTDGGYAIHEVVAVNEAGEALAWSHYDTGYGEDHSGGLLLQGYDRPNMYEVT